MLDVRQVHTNLVGPARFGGEFEQRKSLEVFEDLVESDGFFAGVWSYRIFFPCFGMDAERGIDAVTGEVGGAVDDCEVGFFDFSVLELFGDFPLGGIVFGDDHNAGRIFIESMNDAWPGFAEPGGEFFIMEDECVCDCTVPVASCWVDDNVG